MTQPVKPETVGADGDREAVVLMIHGTYAGAVDDAGRKWWQAGSPVAEKLCPLLPANARIAEPSEVFHWSGENSDRARSKAAAELLRHLESLENRKLDYHLVGHSHGGSVIWNALQMSVLTKRPLAGLLSWTTVGTPFMQHRSPGALNIKNLLGLIVGLVMLAPAMGAPKQLATTLYNIALNNRAAVTLEPSRDIGYANILRAPVLALVETLGVPVERRSDAVLVGSFDPQGDLTLAQYFFTTLEGLFLLGLMVALSYFFIHCAALCIAPAIESFRVRLEQRLRETAFQRFGAKWIGLWSPDDEAINGLRATLHVTVTFVRKIMPREVVYLSDAFGLLSRPYYWLLGPLYNRFVHPTIDGKVRNLVTRAAQGSDRPGAILIDVVPYPLATENFTPPPLPALLNVKLLSFANRHAHDLVPKLRNLIARTSFTSGLETFGRELSGKELVHTAYFEQEEILKLLAANVRWGTSPGADNPGLRPLAPWLRKWFVAYKTALSGEAQETPTLQPEQSTPTARRKAG